MVADTKCAAQAASVQWRWLAKRRTETARIMAVAHSNYTDKIDTLALKKAKRTQKILQVRMQISAAISANLRWKASISAHLRYKSNISASIDLKISPVKLCNSRCYVPTRACYAESSTSMQVLRSYVTMVVLRYAKSGTEAGGAFVPGDVLATVGARSSNGLRQREGAGTSLRTSYALPGTDQGRSRVYIGVQYWPRLWYGRCRVAVLAVGFCTKWCADGSKTSTDAGCCTGRWKAYGTKITTDEGCCTGRWRAETTKSGSRTSRRYSRSGGGIR
eukprot:2762054-Rhodomonas_salina.3